MPVTPAQLPYCHRSTAGCWAGIGEDCRPRTTWRPHTLAGSAVLPPLRLTGVFHADQTLPRQDVSSPFLPACATTREQVLAHTQVRDSRGSAAACCSPALGTPIPLAANFFEISESILRLFLHHHLQSQVALYKSSQKLFLHLDGPMVWVSFHGMPKDAQVDLQKRFPLNISSLRRVERISGPQKSRSRYCVFASIAISRYRLPRTGPPRNSTCI